jgi:uncharacterized RDD family membrane protein YckC
MAYAGFGRRALAAIIDLPLCGLAAFVAEIAMLAIATAVNAALGRTLNLDPPTLGTQALVQIVVLIAAWLYFAGAESSRWQGTPGKLVAGIRVTGMDGERISFGRATKRLLCKVLSSIAAGAGFLRVFVASNRQAFHDRPGRNPGTLENRHAGSEDPAAIRKRALTMGSYAAEWIAGLDDEGAAK